MTTKNAFAASLSEIAQPLAGTPRDFDPVVAAAGQARFALIGEASHGTHEFYRVRAEITKRLIRECGFRAVAVEADWPDAYRVNRYVRGASDDRDAVEAIDDFKRFPHWMWRNADVLDFVAAGIERMIDAVNRGTVDRLYLLRSYEEDGRVCPHCQALQRAATDVCRWCSVLTESIELGEAMVQRVLAADGDVASVEVHGGLARKASRLNPIDALRYE